MLNFINLSRLKDWKNILLLNPDRAHIRPGINLDYSFDKCNTSNININIIHTKDKTGFLTDILEYLKLFTIYKNGKLKKNIACVLMT